MEAADITDLLRKAANGDRDAEDRLLIAVYPELRRLAARVMQPERKDHTLEPTAVAHETCLRLIRIRDVEWRDRAHFFAVAAQIIRRILVDHARAVRAGERSGALKRVSPDAERADETLAGPPSGQ